MTRFRTLAAVIGWLMISCCFDNVADAEGPAELTPFFARHCHDCHDAATNSGGLNLVDLSTDLSDPQSSRRWTLVHDRIAAGDMPPADADPPAVADRQTALQKLSSLLTQADRARREVVLRRLNRIEYEHTIRDLFGVDVRLQEILPEDASAHGFQNIGEALSVSAELMEAYLRGAELTLDAVFGSPEPPEQFNKTVNLKDTIRNNEKKNLRVTDDGVILFNSGYNPSVPRGCSVPQPGSYRVRIETRAVQSERPVTMRLQAGVHGRYPSVVVGFYDIPPNETTILDVTVYQQERWDTIEPNPYGTIHNVGGKADTYDGAGLFIGDITMEGPLEAWPPPSRKRLLGDVDPKQGTPADARQILTRLLPIAVRRPIRAGEVEPYVALAKESLDEGRSFEQALRRGLKAILCSPEFLFLEEHAPELDDHAVASRLSYFLWSSMPDEALRLSAARGELSKPRGLRAQVERMLNDPKAGRFTENFTDQWLMLRDIDFTLPDRKLYPDYDDLLRLSMLEEPRRFFQELLDSDLSLLNFIDSEFVIINERLALHYEIAGVSGQEFRRVDLPADSVRGGVLTQAAVMKVTANGTNTSPVIRGAWVLENILGQPVPPPPPGIPGVDPDIRGATTIREQLDKHRNDSTCARCHSKIDPPGFALESFDVIGGWRDYYRTVGNGKWLSRDPKFPYRHRGYRRGPDVDPTGATADGQDFQDIRDYKRLLLAEHRQVAKCLTEKLLTYALGRGLGFSDRPVVEGIAADVAERGYGFRTLVHEIVQSQSFRQP